jgi:hypothetical protein
MREPKLRYFLAFAVVLFVFATEAGAQEEKAEGKIVSNTMKMTLRNQLELSGSPVDVENIQLNSLFGETKIPLHTIAGIRFAQEGNEQTTVVLLNGDALTGDVNLPEIGIVSDWGEATVNGAHLVSVVFRDDLAWSAVNTPNGRRWRLTKIQPGATTNAMNNGRYFDAQGRRVYPGNR